MEKRPAVTVPDHELNRNRPLLLNAIRPPIIALIANRLTEARLLDGAEVLVANLALLERLVRSACRFQNFTSADVDDFSSWVRLKLVEDDYAILRKFEGRCALSTYLAIVVQRLLADYRNHLWGKWRPSAYAERTGPLAVRIETLVVRDRLSPDDAFQSLQASGEKVSRSEFDAIVAALPERRGRPRAVSIEEADAALTVSSDEVESDASRDERTAAAENVQAVLRKAIASLDAEDRAILRMHFDGGMRVVEIARALHHDQKKMYRRIERICSFLREHLSGAGIDAARASELIGRSDVGLDFGLRAVGIAATGPSSIVRMEVDAEEKAGR